MSHQLSNTLTISEVSRKLNVSQHTLRFWEKELKGVLTPLRTKGGQRRYAFEHLSIIEEIKELRGKGLSLAEIKQKMGGGKSSSDTNFLIVDRVAKEIAELVRLALQSFLQKQGIEM